MIKAVRKPSKTERAIAGDTAAFTELLREHDDSMRALAFKMLGDQTAMDDALQSAYLKAFKGISNFRADASFATWLNRIVVNSCYDLLRASGRRAEVSLNEATDVQTSGSHEDRLAAGQQLQDALQTLPADQRAAVLLVDGEGLSYSEAAEALGVERGTVASRLNRARGELRRQLGMQEEMDR